MCVGAMVHARSRADRVRGAGSEDRGVRLGARSDDERAFNHRIEVTGGVLQEESAALLKRFFAERR